MQRFFTVGATKRKALAELRRKLRRRLGRIVGDACVGHAALMPGAKRLNGTWDRIIVSIGHAIEIRDDAFDWMVRE